jgi:hypothetical protein
VTRNVRRERLTVEKLGADCIDVRMLNRAHVFTGEARRVWFGLRWPRLSGMIAYRYRLELRFGRESFTQNVRVSWMRCHLGGERPWFIALDVAGALQGFIGAASSAAIAVDSVSAILPTGAKQKVLQGGDCMGLGNCGCASAHTRSMILCPNALSECSAGHTITCGRGLRHWKSPYRVVSEQKHSTTKI